MMDRAAIQADIPLLHLQFPYAQHAADAYRQHCDYKYHHAASLFIIIDSCKFISLSHANALSFVLLYAFYHSFFGKSLTSFYDFLKN